MIEAPPWPMWHPDTVHNQSSDLAHTFQRLPVLDEIASITYIKLTQGQNVINPADMLNFNTIVSFNDALSPHSVRAPACSTTARSVRKNDVGARDVPCCSEEENGLFTITLL